MVLNGNDATVIEAAAIIRANAIAKKIGENKSNKKRGKKKKSNKVQDTPKLEIKAAATTSPPTVVEGSGGDTTAAIVPVASGGGGGEDSAISGEDADERKAEALREKDKLNESIISRGCLYAQDVTGRSVFHLAAEAPALFSKKPEIAVEMMSKLMERITAQPCGIGVWNNSIDDVEDLNVTEPEDGYEQWPATIENGFTAWHIIVSHVMSSKVCLCIFFSLLLA